MGKSSLLLEALGVGVAVFSALAWKLLPADAVLSIDGFYHFTIARLMWETGPVVDITWLPLTVLGEAGPDHHWLWHLLLAPFGAVRDPVLGMKLALAFNAALVPAAFYWVCRRLDVRSAWLWTLLLLAGGLPFTSRLLMLRGQNIAIVYLLLAVWAVLERRVLALALLGFLAMASYHGAIVVALPVGVHFLVRGGRDAVWDLRLPAALAGGIALGLLCNPWFPANISYLVFHALFKATNAMHLPVGPEWQPAPWRELLRWSWLAHVGVLVGVAAAWRLDRARLASAPALTLLALCVAGLLAYRYAQRFVEYYFPLAMLTAGWLAGPGLAALASRTRAAALAAGVGIALFEIHAELGYYDAKTRTRFDAYQEIAATLDARAEPGSLVFNSHWDDFPLLLWHTRRFRFVSGLDPHFLGYVDPERSRAWFEISAGGRPGEDVGRAIREIFGADWVVLRHYDRALRERLMQSPSAELVRSDEWGYLFRLHPP